MIARELLIYVIVFAAALSLAVFFGIVFMTNVWVKAAEQLKRNRSTRRRQFMMNNRQIVTER